VIEVFPHSKGEWAGKPFVLEGWQAFIVWVVFGWYRLTDEHEWVRRFNAAFVSVGRKNGKSTLGAAIGLKLFVFDDEPGAEVFTAATKRAQAKIVHEEAKRMVRKSPSLQRLVTTRNDNLSCEALDSKYEPLGKDEGTDDGLNVSGAIFDEIHAHKTRDLWDVLETATGSRRNPLLFGITTAGLAGDHESIYAELKAYSEKVLNGIIDEDTWFAFIATLDEGDKWDDESVWPKANPNLGVSAKLDDMRRKCRKAQKTPAAVNNFRRKQCNQDVESLDPWVSDDDWKACGGGDFYDRNGLRPEVIERFRNRPCFVGGDLSSIKDLTALVFGFRDDSGGVDLLSMCWCPRENALGRTQDGRVPYLSWAQEGYLELTEGNSVDHNAIRAALRTARDDWGWDIRRLDVDPSNARTLVTLLVEEDGFAPTSSGDVVVERLQTCNWMNDPIGLTEKAVLDGKLRHGGHKVLRWCVSNVVVYTDTGGRRRFDKKNAREKIDLAVAAVMAAGNALGGPPPTDSVYNRRGLIVL
jgi:phage terminase large subunit-like protein